MTLTIAVPRASRQEDLVDTLAAFHEALLDVVAWLPTIVDANGATNPRDARWLRAFLRGPLVWHLENEQDVLVPWLALRQNDGLDACAERAGDKRALVALKARELAALIDPACEGNPVSRRRWIEASEQFAAAVDDDVGYERDVELPSARAFLSPAERAAMTRGIVVRDEARPWADVAAAGDTPLVHLVHAVRTRTAAGDDVVRSFAACPRRAAVSVESCRGCPHLESLTVGRGGTGTVGCAIDDSKAPKEARVGDVMTRDVRCVEAGTPIDDVVRILATACVGALPVVDQLGRPVGVVSQADIIDALAQQRDPLQHLVSEVMTSVPVVVREGDTVDHAARLLLGVGIHHLPVVSGSGLVVGVLSSLDLLRASVQPQGLEVVSDR
ncbi:MAG: CBS domain-containing protein [Deltaproteobacteria bacterium]|nr:CBS domain-containing protein [Deltaproteobacteria bacterium]